MARENGGTVFRGLGFETSVLEPCVLVLRSTQQKYHDIIGVDVDDIASRWIHACWAACSHQESGLCAPRETEKGTLGRYQAADGSMRVGQPAYIKSLGFVLLGKLRKEQSGDTSVSEKTAMRSVLGSLGYLARETRPDLSGLVSILQSRFNKAQVSDTQETNRVVRLAKAHTDLALPVCKVPEDNCALCLYGDANGGSTRAEQTQAGYVIMFADRALLEGMAAPVTLVSWRSHRVKRVVVLLQQKPWVTGCVLSGARWCWVREWREQENVPPLISVTDSKGNYDHSHNETVGPSEDRRSAIDLAITREDLSRPQMFLRWVDGKAQVADALTKLHGDGDLLRAVCRQAFTVLDEAPETMAAKRQEKSEREKVPRVKSPLKLREPVDEASMSVTTTTTVT